MRNRKNRRRRRSNKPHHQIKIANERIALLFEEAEKMARIDKSLAKRYVEIARKIGMRYNVRLPAQLKRKFCTYCHAYLKPGLTCNVKVSKGVVKITCFECMKTTRIPYK